MTVHSTYQTYFVDVADTVETLTPQRMKGIRVMLNASAMDILYYTSPLYRTEVGGLCIMELQCKKMQDKLCYAKILSSLFSFAFFAQITAKAHTQFDLLMP